MKPATSCDVTILLQDINAGKASMADLLAVVYPDLRRQARQQLRRRAGHTLNTTALVHEVAGRLLDGKKSNWEQSSHFFAIAAKAMGQVLVEHARRRRRLKRGGGYRRVMLSESLAAGESKDVDLLELQEALSELTRMDPRMAQVVECRFFAGMTLREIAQALSVSVSTIESDWRTARAWLSQRIQGHAA